MGGCGTRRPALEDSPLASPAGSDRLPARPPGAWEASPEVAEGRNVRVLLFQIWVCQNLIKHSALFVQQLDGSDRLTCLFQIKRLLSLCCR